MLIIRVYIRTQSIDQYLKRAAEYDVNYYLSAVYIICIEFESVTKKKIKKGVEGNRWKCCGLMLCVHSFFPPYLSLWRLCVKMKSFSVQVKSVSFGRGGGSVNFVENVLIFYLHTFHFWYYYTKWRFSKNNQSLCFDRNLIENIFSVDYLRRMTHFFFIVHKIKKLY